MRILMIIILLVLASCATNIETRRIDGKLMYYNEYRQVWLPYPTLEEKQRAETLQRLNYDLRQKRY